MSLTPNRGGRYRRRDRRHRNCTARLRRTATVSCGRRRTGPPPPPDVLSQRGGSTPLLSTRGEGRWQRCGNGTTHCGRSVKGDGSSCADERRTAPSNFFDMYWRRFSYPKHMCLSKALSRGQIPLPASSQRLYQPRRSGRGCSCLALSCSLRYSYCQRPCRPLQWPPVASALLVCRRGHSVRAMGEPAWTAVPQRCGGRERWRCPLSQETPHAPHLCSARYLLSPRFPPWCSPFCCHWAPC